jgi:integrase
MIRRIQAKSAAEAAGVRDQLRLRIEGGGEEHGPKRVRLADAATSWIHTKLAAWKASTRRQYAHVLDDHVIPKLGDYYLDALTPADIARWRDRQRAKPATVNGRLRALKQMLADVCYEHEVRNPAERIQQIREPKRDEAHGNSLTAQELRAVLDAVRRHEPRWYPLFLTLAYTGARFGAVTALKWTDVDIPNRILRIRRSQWRQVVSNELKSGAWRKLPMPEELAEVLEAHRRWQVETQAPGLEQGWCFPTEAGTLLFQASLRKPLDRALAAAGVERHFTVHGFRHAFNNLARQVSQGEVVRALTGHVTEEMTEHYSHIGLDERRAAMHGVLRLVHGGGDHCGDHSGPETENGQSANER